VRECDLIEGKSFLFTKDRQAVKQAAQGDFGASMYGGFQDVSTQNPKQPDLISQLTALSRDLD